MAARILYYETREEGNTLRKDKTLTVLCTGEHSRSAQEPPDLSRAAKVHSQSVKSRKTELGDQEPRKDCRTFAISRRRESRAELKLLDLCDADKKRCVNTHQQRKDRGAQRRRKDGRTVGDRFKSVREHTSAAEQT